MASFTAPSVSVSSVFRSFRQNQVSNLRKASLSFSGKSFPSHRLPALRFRVASAVEIVMGLEEEFGISVEEESAQRITTVQEAADLNEKLSEKRNNFSTQSFARKVFFEIISAPIASLGKFFSQHKWFLVFG